MGQHSKPVLCEECSGKEGMHALFCSKMDAKELEFGSLIFAYIDGDVARSRGEPRAAPAGLSEDAAWTWLAAYDKAAQEKG